MRHISALVSRILAKISENPEIEARQLIKKSGNRNGHAQILREPVSHQLRHISALVCRILAKISENPEIEARQLIKKVGIEVVMRKF